MTAVVLILVAAPAAGCKNRTFPAHLSREELAAYTHVMIAKVLEVIPTGERSGAFHRYARPFKARLTVVRALRGTKPSGEAFDAITSLDEAHAVCPLELEPGKTYLLIQV